jgi:hypothetical protein
VKALSTATPEEQTAVTAREGGRRRWSRLEMRRRVWGFERVQGGVREGRDSESLHPLLLSPSLLSSIDGYVTAACHVDY